MSQEQQDQQQQPQKNKKLIVFAIVGASTLNEEHFLQNYNNGVFSRIIAADGGYKKLDDLGIVPNLAIGDFDSLGFVPEDGKKTSLDPFNPNNPNDPCRMRMQVMQYPANKDKSDLELAAQEAISLKAQCIMIYGASGGRLDHELSSIQVLSRISDFRIGAFGVGMTYSCIVMNGPSEFGLGARPGVDVDRTLSVFSLTDISAGIESVGLKWNYTNTPLTNASSLGLSNEIIDNNMKIKVKQGKLLVMFNTKLLMN